MLICLGTEFKTVSIENWLDQGVGLSYCRRISLDENLIWGIIGLGIEEGQNGERRGTKMGVVL